jgi:glyoxylase-like metal-dependent hydrolase (beta-lactamase superfamily II)
MGISLECMKLKAPGSGGRRSAAATLSLIGLSALLTLSTAYGAGSKAELPRVTIFASPEAGIFSNAYLVQTAHHVVAIDATLLESTSNAFRTSLEELHKPLAAVLITHGHPDHYNGITNLLNGETVDVISTKAVDRVIREYDAAKEQQWRPTFGAEWPAKRTFPNHTLSDGGSIVVDGVTFTVHDLGQGESHADSYWVVEAGSRRIAFIGDVVLNHVHAFMTDGHSTHWLQNIERLKRELKGVETIYPGHGEAGGLELLAWERGYLERYRSEVASLARGSTTLSDDQKATLLRTMEEYLPNKKLEFLIALGADPVAAELKSEAQ